MLLVETYLHVIGLAGAFAVRLFTSRVRVAPLQIPNKTAGVLRDTFQCGCQQPVYNTSTTNVKYNALLP